MAPDAYLRSNEWVCSKLNVSNFLGRTARTLTEEKGIIPSMTPKSCGRTIPENVIILVKGSMKITKSRPLACMKDYKKIISMEEQNLSENAFFSSIKKKFIDYFKRIIQT